MKIFWRVEATVIMVAQLWYNYGTLSLQNLTYLSLQVILYVSFLFYCLAESLEVNRALTHLNHSILLPLKSTLLATLS